MLQTTEMLAQEELYVEIEANLLARFVYLSQSSQMRLYIEPELTWFTTDISYPHYVFNIVLRANFAACEAAHAYIDRLVQDAQGRRTSLFWCVGPATQPADLGRYLLQRQFSLALSATAMHLHLDRLNKTGPTIPDHEVVRVESLTQLKEFIAIQTHNSQLPTDAAEAWFDLEADIGLPGLLARSAGGHGLDRGRGEGSGGLVPGGHPAPRSRSWPEHGHLPGRNAGRRRHGHRRAILHSTPMGLNVYRRLGFEPVTNVDIYLWSGQETKE